MWCGAYPASAHTPMPRLHSLHTQETLQMCSSGPLLTNGTQCGSPNVKECEQGCDFGDRSAGAPQPAVWKALLRPAPAGGAYTWVG